jgi:hypothetical protein
MAAGHIPLTLANAQEYYNRELHSSPRNKRPRIHCEDDESSTGNNADGVEVQLPTLDVPTYSYWEWTEARKLFMARESTSAFVSVHEKIDICQTKAMQSDGKSISYKYLL